MSAFMAIVGDTWRQSKTQVVFLIMIIMLLLASVAAIVLPTAIEDENGVDQFGFIFKDEAVDGLARQWNETYAMSEMVARGETINMFSKEGREWMETISERRKEVEEKTAHISDFRKSIEMYCYGVGWVVFFISMALFIAASSGYFPDLLAAGAVDVVLAKPLARLQILLGKYFGGLLLFGVVLAVTYLVLFVGIGLRTGEWHARMFNVIPLQMFCGAVLYALLTLLGVMFRSTALSMVIGYLFYFVVDTILGWVIGFQVMGAMKDIAWLDKTVTVLRFGFPNFGVLRDTALATTLTMPYIDWTPVFVGSVWLALTLGLAYLLFRTRDY